MDAKSLHRDSIVIDAHGDALHWAPLEGRGLTERGTVGHADLPRLKEGGVTCQVFAMSGLAGGEAALLMAVLQELELFYSTMDETPELVLATKADHVHKAKAEGRIAGILGLEGSEALQGNVGMLRFLYRQGLRNLGLTHNARNRAGDGVSESGTGGGLTRFGVELVREANRLGIMVDLAHLAPAGVRDALRVSETPPIVSHAGARAVCDHPRNLSDEQLEALAARGGVCCVIFWPAVLSVSQERQSVEGVVDHIDHIAHVAGVDHVGLGSDFDGYGARSAFSGPGAEALFRAFFPEMLNVGKDFYGIGRARAECLGLEDASHYGAITDVLVRRGYKPDDVCKILGGNLLRVFEQVAG